MARNWFKALFGRGAKNDQKAQSTDASDITPMLMTGMVLGATAGDSPKGDGMNEGDYRSGSEGYSPNTAYPDSQYGSLGGYDGGFDGGGAGGGGGD
jgi:hypothetical protein